MLAKRCMLILSTALLLAGCGSGNGGGGLLGTYFVEPGNIKK